MRKIFVVVLSVSLAAVMAAPAFAGGRPLTADLSFDNEVPPASGTAATGSAAVTLNQGQGEVCFSIELSGLSGAVLAGHIHVGPAGSNGGIVVNLDLASGLSGCVNASPDAIKAIRQNPSGYYINVHTALNPGGEVRGQLSK